MIEVARCLNSRIQAFLAYGVNMIGIRPHSRLAMYKDTETHFLPVA